MLRVISRAVLKSAQASSVLRSPLPLISQIAPLSVASFRRQLFSSAAPPADSRKTPEEADPSESAEKPEENLDVLKKRLDEAEIKHKNDLEELSKRISELDDKYKRALAETENVRLRLQRQIDDAKQFGVQAICKDLLEVVDVLQNARSFAPLEQIEKDEKLKNAYDGIAMTDEIMLKVLGKHGVEKVEPKVGHEFDPNIHEAKFQTPDPTGKDGAIAVVINPGYLLNGRLLRAAAVGVVKH